MLTKFLSAFIITLAFFAIYLSGTLSYDTSYASPLAQYPTIPPTRTQLDRKNDLVLYTWASLNVDTFTGYLSRDSSWNNIYSFSTVLFPPISTPVYSQEKVGVRLKAIDVHDLYNKCKSRVKHICKVPSNAQICYSSNEVGFIKFQSGTAYYIGKHNLLTFNSGPSYPATSLKLYTLYPYSYIYYGGGSGTTVYLAANEQTYRGIIEPYTSEDVCANAPGPRDFEND